MEIDKEVNRLWTIAYSDGRLATITTLEPISVPSKNNGIVTEYWAITPIEHKDLKFIEEGLKSILGSIDYMNSADIRLNLIRLARYV